MTGGTKTVEVKGADFAYGFDPATGLLTSIQYQGAELLAGPLRPDFWRAAERQRPRQRHDERLGPLARRPPLPRRSAASARETPAKGVVAPVAGGRPRARSGARYDVTYTVYGNGDLVVDVVLRARATRSCPTCPRFGMQAKLVPGFEHARLVRPRPAGDLRRPPRPAGRRLQDDGHRQLLPATRSRRRPATRSRCAGRRSPTPPAPGCWPWASRSLGVNALHHSARGHGPGGPPPPDAGARARPG